jgi:hypothetical protein
MFVSINELALATEKLFEHLKELEIQSVELTSDYYWVISKDQRYNVYEKPTDFTIGQLQSDWQELEKVLSGQRKPLAYHFVWLAALLRSIGEEVIQ